MKKKTAIVLIAITCVVSIAISQTMNINTIDGSTQTFEMSEIESITFSIEEPTPTTVTDIDGNVYPIVTIGDQVWMASNLKVTHFRNGDALPYVVEDAEWPTLTSAAFCFYENKIENLSVYGALYNGYAVLDSRNIAPEGWHVATDEDWKELEEFMGMDPNALDIIGPRGTDEGGKLKEMGTEHWTKPNYLATDEYDFTALPGGWRNRDNGVFENMGNNVYFWTGSETGTGSVWRRTIGYDHAVIDRGGGAKVRGFSVRCVKD